MAEAEGTGSRTKAGVGLELDEAAGGFVDLDIGVQPHPHVNEI